MRPTLAVIVTAVLCAVSIALSGFMLGVIAALVTSIIWGFLYEWRKSMPLVIVAHVVLYYYYFSVAFNIITLIFGNILSLLTFNLERRVFMQKISFYSCIITNSRISCRL